MGKELIQNIVRLTRQDQFAQPDRLRRGLRHERRPATGPGRRRLAEQSATAAGSQRHLGSRRPLLNGTLNFSILDGWWAEAYDGTNGFAIGIGQTHAIPSVQDERDHKALIETLTDQVIPLYYKRDASGLAPRVDRPAEERFSDPGLAVQCGPDGDGLRAARLSAGGRRRVVLDAPILTE